MNLRKLRKTIKAQRENAVRRFIKQKRINPLAPPGQFKFVLVLDHLQPSYNIGKIFRSADAFGAHEIHLVGINFFDPSPAVGSFKWVRAHFHDDFQSCYQQLDQKGYNFFALEPGNGKLVNDIQIPEKSAFILGNEEHGISFSLTHYSRIQALKIPQFGKVQSLNVSVAASIVMYEYLRQHQFLSDVSIDTDEEMMRK